MPAATDTLRAAHIGIVACSGEGAALCYRTICTEGAALMGGWAHPEVTLHTPPLSDYVAALDRDDIPTVAELMLRSAEILAAAGANFLICPDNTVHQALHLVTPRSPLPWLHIADVVAEEAIRKSARCVGITGTRWLTNSDVYPDALKEHGLDWRRPPGADIDALDEIIVGDLVHGRFTEEAIATYAAIIARLADAGCDAVVMGCTELPLIMDDTRSPLPTLDSTRLLARAALRRAINSG